ncbi:MAG: DNA-binding protein [Bacillota bacterium]|nr:DNA-binding protein [Bacillota bacterium]
MAQKLPLRYRILHFLSDNGSYSVDDVMAALKDEYGGEGQFKRPLIANHLQSLKAVGMLEHCDVYFDDNGQLVQKFKITEYGFSRLDYLPTGWQPLSKSINA